MLIVRRGYPAATVAPEQWEPRPGPNLLAWKPPDQRPRNFEQIDERRIKRWESMPEAKKWTRVHSWINKPRIPSEPELWERLKRAESPHQIRAVCEASVFWLNRKRINRPYMVRLGEHAEKFLVGKRYRYPIADRPTSETKRVLHFARAMAGIMEGVSPARAVDLIRLLKHGIKCTCLECRIKRVKRSKKAFEEITGISAGL